MSQKNFGFMAAWLVRQWICHGRNVTKTDIFTAQAGGQSGNRLGGVSDLIRPGQTRH